MGIGSARGEDRSVAAAEMAVSSPLLEASIDGAHGVLLSIAGGSDLGLFEINEAAALVSQAAHAEANIIFGATIDDALGDEVRVTVIAAGFDGGMPKRRDNGTVLRREPAPQQSQAETRAAAQAATQAATNQRQPAPQAQDRQPAQRPAPSNQQRPAQEFAPQTQAQPQRQSGQGQSGGQGQGGQAPGGQGQGQRPAPSRSEQPSQPSRPQRPVQFDDDDLDIPDFLK
jgi:cell division protein FtsZ